MNNINNKENSNLLQQIDILLHRLQKQKKHIKQLVEIGRALSSKTKIENVFDLMLKEALDYTNADGATIYTLSADKKFLEFKLIYNRSLYVKLRDSDDHPDWPKIPLFTSENEQELKHLVTYVYHTKTAQRMDDVYKQDLFDNKGTLEYDTKHHYRSKSMIAIPLKNHEDDVLGIVQLINAMSEDEQEILPFSDDHLLLMNSLASQAAIALTNKKLIQGLEDLLFQFIKSIAKAIDLKSKFTSNHITRVAKITDIITDAVSASDSGFYKDIHFSEKEKKEISISGWMHDIGKIITPEKIINKSKKLETIVDRIELIKLRFEIIIVNIEKKIMMLQKADGHSAEIQELNNLRLKLLDDLEFVKSKNAGREFLLDEDAERLTEISKFRYKVDEEDYKLITEDELKNLLIKRGTLTEEEFAKMKEHVKTTWEMLSSFTFPKQYKNVPYFASCHHEQLNGKGYPFGYSREDIPLQARIIAVADKFEALASKRPYKKGKSLSEVMSILGTMAKNDVIDKDLFEFILESGLYKTLAEEVLSKENTGSFNIKDFCK
ncbi:MAG: HD domain-containing phosphohydrolase [Candidatus Cloacimonadota bacterium]|nr:HD domain-containing phosphohydrolase [Candidatus Cloacimonadota bacterium]